MKIDITNICLLVISAATLVFTAVLAPYIKSKLDATKLEKIMNWVRIAVHAAEMIYKESGMGAKKKEYVLKFLNEKGLSVDTDSLDNMIESAVMEMNHAITEADK